MKVLLKNAGYGFVDFDSPAYADQAVKGLLAKGIQAQMAKVGIWVLHRPAIVRLLYSLHASNYENLSSWVSSFLPLCIFCN